MWFFLAEALADDCGNGPPYCEFPPTSGETTTGMPAPEGLNCATGLSARRTDVADRVALWVVLDGPALDAAWDLDRDGTPLWTGRRFDPEEADRLGRIVDPCAGWTPGTDADADTDADSDADTDSDTDADSDADADTGGDTGHTGGVARQGAYDAEHFWAYAVVDDGVKPGTHTWTLRSGGEVHTTELTVDGGSGCGGCAGDQASLGLGSLMLAAGVGLRATRRRAA